MTTGAGELVKAQHSGLGEHVIAYFQPAFDHLQGTTADQAWAALRHLSEVAKCSAAQDSSTVNPHERGEKDRTLSENLVFLC